MAYGKVYDSFWDDPVIRSIPDDARTLMLFLLTCRYRNKVGCFVLDPRYAAIDLGWTEERATQAMNDLVEVRRIDYDPEYRIVLVRHFLRYNMLDNPKVAMSAVKELAGLPPSPLIPRLVPILDRLIQEFPDDKDRESRIERCNILKEHILQRFGERAAYGIDTVSDTIALALPLTFPSSRTHELSTSGGISDRAGCGKPVEEHGAPPEERRPGARTVLAQEPVHASPGGSAPARAGPRRAAATIGDVVEEGDPLLERFDQAIGVVCAEPAKRAEMRRDVLAAPRSRLEGLSGIAFDVLERHREGTLDPDIGRKDLIGELNGRRRARAP